MISVICSAIGSQTNNFGTTKKKKKEEKLQGLSFKSRSMSRSCEDEWRMNEVVVPTKEYSPRIDWLWPSVCAATRSSASRAIRNELWDCSPTLCSAVHRRCFERFPSPRYVDYSTLSFSRPFPPSARISRTVSSRGLRSAPAWETRPLPEIHDFPRFYDRLLMGSSVASVLSQCF